MSLKEKAVAGVFWSFIQQFSNQIIAFVLSIILARLLNPSEFGLIGMIGIFMGIGTVLIDSGLGQSLIRTENPTDEDYSTVFFFNLIGSFFIYVVIFFAAPFIADFYTQQILSNIIRVYCLIFIINAFSSVQLTRLSKKMDFKTEMKITIPSAIMSSIVGISLAYNGFGVWSLVYCALVQTTASAIQLWYWSKWRPSWIFSKEKFNMHFSFGYKLTLSAILDTVFNNLTSILIGKFFAPAQLGFYNRADSLKQFPAINISTILNKVTYPLFATIKNDDEKLKEVNKKIMKMVIFIIAPVLFFMAILAEPLFRFLFTEKWLPAVPYFQILCFSGLIYPIQAYNLNILKVKGRSDLFFKLEVIKKIMVAIVIAFAFQFGIYGLLYSTIVTASLSFFINSYYSGKFIKYAAWEQIKDIAPLILLTSICGLIVYLIFINIKNLIQNDLLVVMLCSFLGTILYFCLSIFFKISSLNELFAIIKRK